MQDQSKQSFWKIEVHRKSSKADELEFNNRQKI